MVKWKGDPTIPLWKRVVVDRYSILYAFFLLMGLFILTRLIDLQVIHGTDNEQLANRKMLSISRGIAPRGGIYDRNGIPIATVRTAYRVRISKSRSSAAERQAAFLTLVNILEDNGESYRKELSRYLTLEPLEFGQELRDDPAALEKWKRDMLGKSDTEGLLASPASALQWLRDKKFNIASFYTDQEAYRIMTVMYDILINGYVYINPFASDISRDSVGRLEEARMSLPGITVEETPVRRYVDADAAAHIIGYMGPVDAQEYVRLREKGYSWNDWLGKDGIEYVAEKWLKGTDGLRNLEAEASGDMDTGLQQAVPGYDVTLTIDMRLQKAADKALKDQIGLIRGMTSDPANLLDAFAGAVVVLDVKTGDVLAMASYPDFNPAVYLDRDDPLSLKKIQDWNQDWENAPLLNRAISGMYAPGSTFKPLTAIAAIDAGVLNPNQIYFDPGVIVIDGKEFENVNRYGYGNINLEMAIAHSSNCYFHFFGMRTGIEAIDRMAELFGLGERTGIELPGEISGVRANPTTKKQIWDDIWRPADTAQTAIGQFSQAFSPIQLASYAATIANDGVRCPPRIIKDVVRPGGEKPPDYVHVQEPVQTGVSAYALEQVRKGMLTACYMPYSYTEITFTPLPVKVATKTGTAETGEANHSSNAVFIGIAPADKPEIAIAVVIQRGVWGAYCAPVAAAVIKEYVSRKVETAGSRPTVQDTSVFIP